MGISTNSDIPMALLAPQTTEVTALGEALQRLKVSIAGLAQATSQATLGLMLKKVIEVGAACGMSNRILDTLDASAWEWEQLSGAIGEYTRKLNASVSDTEVALRRAGEGQQYARQLSPGTEEALALGTRAEGLLEANRQTGLPREVSEGLNTMGEAVKKAVQMIEKQIKEVGELERELTTKQDHVRANVQGGTSEAMKGEERRRLWVGSISHTAPAANKSRLIWPVRARR